ncbi:MAG: hypothetical protein IPO09_20995 [Anaeromyxobacter sp.]|nr:hypothetical protein [Anaeromyxobacter sp.]
MRRGSTVPHHTTRPPPARPPTLALALALLLASAGCGGLGTPDLSRGDVVGRLAGASPGAFAYPLGAPERKVTLAADGAFELAGLPAGAARIVLFDGADRADLIEVAVRGAGRVHLERSAAALPLAGRAVMTVVPAGGVAPATPRYAVKETDQAGVAQQAGAAVLYPLPGGAYQVETGMDGYRTTTAAFVVAAGATAGVEIRLPVADAGPAGCAAAGNVCRNDLKCDPASGLCVQCRVGGTDCAGGATCDPTLHACIAASAGGAEALCTACDDASQCGAGGAGYCQKAAGARVGYCTRAGGSPTCPAGFVRVVDGDGDRCALLGEDGVGLARSCESYLEELGENCFGDATCDERDGIAGGTCRGADRDRGVAGYCTAPCGGDADCFVPGFTCHPVDLVCTRTAG